MSGHDARIDEPAEAAPASPPDEFVTAPVGAAGRRARGMRVLVAAAVAAFVLVAALGWIATGMWRSGPSPPGDGVSAGAGLAVDRRGGRTAGRWVGTLAVPGRSPQTAVLVLREPGGPDRRAGADPSAPTRGFDYALLSTTWLVRGRADLDPVSATLRLDGSVRFVRERDADGSTAWTAVAPWQGRLEEAPR
ncbi:MAG: hypothetical protein D6738_02015 [Acidobacteria bacterium]|nr:MAG: hypothetical protein D6738_02015 [Acidobacteriota bacterium]